MSECDGIMHTKKTYNDSSFIAINCGIVNDTFKMGVECASVDNQICIYLIVDAGNEINYLVIHDDSSTKPKGMDVRFNLMG